MKKEALKQNINNVLTGISKYKSLREAETKVIKSNDEVCRAEFEKEKAQILSSLRQNPSKVVERLLADKLRI